MVQEALLRVHQALDAGEQIASPRAFVATVTTRLAINELRSARARRERYVGEWLPEPIITDGARRSGAARRDGRLAVAGDAGAAGEPLARAASGAAASRRVRLRVPRRSRRSSARARTTCASSPPAPDATSSSAGPASRRRASSATSWQPRFFAAAEQGDLAGLEALLAPRRGADRRRRRQGSGARAVAARAQPCRAHADQLARRRPPSRGVVAPRRGQRRPGSALSRRTAAADRARSRRAGSTSARSSSCTAGSSRSATRAARCCSSRSSSRRSSRSPTGSSSSTRARSSASTADVEPRGARARDDRRDARGGCGVTDEPQRPPPTPPPDAAGEAPKRRRGAELARAPPRASASTSARAGSSRR